MPVTNHRSRTATLAALATLAVALTIVLWPTTTSAPGIEPSRTTADAGERPPTPVAPENRVAEAATHGDATERIHAHGDPTKPELLVRVAEADGSPIQGAELRVTWRSPDSQQEAHGLSDDAGRCHLPIVRGASADVRATHAGHASTSRWLPPLDSPSELLLQLAPAAQVTIQVVATESGSPLAGARVFPQISREWPPLPSETTRSNPGVDLDATAPTTDADGRLVVNDLEPGFMDFVVVARGRQARRCEGVEAPSDKVVRIELDAGHELGVVVRDQEGAAVVGREVHFMAKGSDVFSTLTDSTGHAVSPGYPAGTMVTAALGRKNQDPLASLMESLTGRVQGRALLPAREELQLIARERPCGIEVAWTPPSIDEELTIELIRLQDGHRATLPTDVCRVRAGTGSVRLTPITDGSPCVVQAVGEQSGLWRSEEFQPSCTTPIRITLRHREARTGTLHIEALSPGGPVSGAEVEVLLATPKTPLLGRPESSPLPLVRSTTTDRFGMAIAERLLAGRYVVVATHPDGRTGWAAVDVDEATKLELPMMGSGTLDGTMLPPTGHRTSITAKERSTRWQRTTLARTDGTFTMSLPAGDYEVSAKDLELVTSPFDAQRSMVVPVVITSDRVTTCQLSVPTTTRRVEVQVNGLPDGAAFEAVFERLNPFDQRGATSVKTSRPISRAGVAIANNIGTDADFAVAVVRPSDMQVLGVGFVPRGEGPARLVVGLDGVSVKVTAAPRDKASDLRLVPLSPSGVPTRAGALVPRPTNTGDAEFQGVPPGRYLVASVEANGRLGSMRGAQAIDVGHGDLSIPWRAPR